MLDNALAELSKDRATITHEWVTAQARSNFYAGVGAMLSIGVPLTAIVILLQMYVGLWTWRVFALAWSFSVLAGLGYFGWLQFTRFSMDEWIESGQRQQLLARVSELEGADKERNNLAERNRELRKENDNLRRMLKAKAPLTRQAEPPPPVAAKAPPVPRNVVAARVIIREWFNDPSIDHQGVSRQNLMKMGQLSRSEVDEGWYLLQVLKVASKQGDAINAKWVLTETDEHEINHRISQHLTNPVETDVVNV